MNTRDELRAAEHQAAEESAAIRRGEPYTSCSDCDDVSECAERRACQRVSRLGIYSWPDVKPYQARPLLSPTLVLDNTSQELADRLAGLHPVMADALRPLIFRPLP